MSESIFPAFAVSRLRMATDGEGVTTLVTAAGCPLRCRLCINPQSWDGSARVTNYTPEKLLQAVKIDNLYFLSTGGGVTFGGGEPLLYIDFLEAFRAICPKGWKLRAETCLNLPADTIRRAAKVIDEFIVDIKDTDPEIYRRYTGRDNAQVLTNLEYLVNTVGADRITVRVPKIPGFNSDENKARSIARLQEMGIKNIDSFEYVDPSKRP